MADQLIWGSDEVFDHNASAMDMRALVAFIQEIQTEMAKEQAEFDTLRRQMEKQEDVMELQRISARLCACQTRLAHLAARNIKCFSMQAMRCGPTTDTRAEAPNSESPLPFHESLQYFQKAAENAQNNLMMAKHAQRRKANEENASGEANRSTNPNNIYESIPEKSVVMLQPQEPVNGPANQQSANHSSGLSGEPTKESSSGAEGDLIRRWKERNGATSQNQTGSLALPKRRPQLKLGTDLADLTDFKERIGIVPGRSSLTRVQSLKEGLNEDGAYHSTLSRTHSYSTGLERTGLRRDEGLQRVPSVEEILESVKQLRAHQKDMKTTDTDGGKKGRSKLKSKSQNARPSVGALSNLFDSSKDLGQSPEHCYENLNANNHYENLNGSALYDEPRKIDLQLYETIRSQNSEIHYENVPAENHSEPTYMNVTCEENTNLYENMRKDIEYDVPRSATHIYDSPQKPPRRKEPSEYDVPRASPNQCLVPQASQLLLESQRHDCDRDSLDGEEQHPDIPSPDYGSEDEETTNYLAGDYVDEGLESDARSYYNDDQGLEVIIEEPEEEEEDLGSDQGKGSLEESEGIGSGESHSSEEDSGSSGIHSDGCGSPPANSDTLKKEQGEERDRVIEVYPETVRQRKAANKDKDKVDITRLGGHEKVKPSSQKDLDSPAKVKKFLPSVKALRSQFESKPSIDASNNAKNSTNAITENQPRQTIGKTVNKIVNPVDVIETSSSVEEPIQSIIEQFKEVDKELLKPKITTTNWDPTKLLSTLYDVPEPIPAAQNKNSFINLEGWLEKLPSGRRKATFWNAWKRRYFRLKDGYLSYSTNSHSEKASMTLQLLGGRIDTMDNTMLGVDDGKTLVDTMIGIDDMKGHYVVVRCGSKDSTERWRKALTSHTVDDYHSAYTLPWPIPRDPNMLRDTLIIDLGSHSVRAGVLASQPTLPQVFFPSVMAVNKETGKAEFGVEALLPDVRLNAHLVWPARPSQKITKFSIDLGGVTGLLRKTFLLLNVDPRKYSVQLVASRAFSASTLAEITRILMDKFGVNAVNVSHQAVLTLWAYNATSGIAVDIGERIDVVPITDGYVVEGGVSRVPYGGARIVDHLRHFLLQKHYSMMTEVESYLIHYILEKMCYCSSNYAAELSKFKLNPNQFDKSLPVQDFFQDKPLWSHVKLDAGRFQVTEGLFNPDAWGLDNSGIHKLVHRAIQECGVDVRRELSRSIFLSGGVTMLPGFCERLQAELTRLVPALSPKVHASPYRYHAAYLGACQLANSPGFSQSKVSREEWSRLGSQCVTKWSLL